MGFNSGFKGLKKCRAIQDGLSSNPFDLYSVGAQLDCRAERRFPLSFQVNSGLSYYRYFPDICQLIPSPPLSSFCALYSELLTELLHKTNMYEGRYESSVFNFSSANLIT